MQAQSNSMISIVRFSQQTRLSNEQRYLSLPPPSPSLTWTIFTRLVNSVSFPEEQLYIYTNVALSRQAVCHRRNFTRGFVVR